jgi:hypothetical protein
LEKKIIFSRKEEQSKAGSQDVPRCSKPFQGFFQKKKIVYFLERTGLPADTFFPIGGKGRVEGALLTLALPSVSICLPRLPHSTLFRAAVRIRVIGGSKPYWLKANRLDG